MADKEVDTEDKEEDMEDTVEDTEDREEDREDKAVSADTAAPGTADKEDREEQAGMVDREVPVGTAALADREEQADKEAPADKGEQAGTAATAGRAGWAALGDQGDPSSCRHKEGGRNGSSSGGGSSYEKTRSNRIFPLTRGTHSGNTRLGYAWNRILSSEIARSVVVLFHSIQHLRERSRQARIGVRGQVLGVRDAFGEIESRRKRHVGADIICPPETKKPPGVAERPELIFVPS